MYRSVDVDYYDGLDSIKQSLNIAVKMDLLVKKLYKKSRNA